MSPYPEFLVAPMRAELTQFGVEELRTPEDVDAAVKTTEGTLMIVNLTPDQLEVALLEEMHRWYGRDMRAEDQFGTANESWDRSGGLAEGR